MNDMTMMFDLIGLGVCVFLGCFGWGLYNYLSNKKK